MSIVQYFIGTVDQIGGIIKLPKSITHLPFNQGDSIQIPSGLSITSNRKFIWKLEKNYTGVTLSNELSETPILTFDLDTFFEPLVKIRCQIVGQPNNFVSYTVTTSLGDGILFNSKSLREKQYANTAIDTLIITLDDSKIEEAAFVNNATSNITLTWNRPEKSDGFIIENYNNGWIETGRTNNLFFIINPSISNFRVSATNKNYIPSKNRSARIKDNLLLGKSFLELDLKKVDTKNNVSTSLLKTFYAKVKKQPVQDLFTIQITKVAQKNKVDLIKPLFFNTIIEEAAEDYVTFNSFSIKEKTKIHIKTDKLFWVTNSGI